MSSDISEIRNRLSRATKGKFEIDPDNAGTIWTEDDDGYVRVLQVYRTAGLQGPQKCDEQFEDDIQFFLNAKTDMQKLLDEIHRLQNRIDYSHLI